MRMAHALLGPAVLASAVSLSPVQNAAAEDGAANSAETEATPDNTGETTNESTANTTPDTTATESSAAEQAPSPDTIEEIVVTAQRRQERIQDIPLAISAFTEEQIQSQGIVSMENIAPRVPSFFFGSFGAARPQLYIRGIGTRSFDPGSESSVGVFSDEVYLGRSSGSFGALKDIARVEVLRGPKARCTGATPSVAPSTSSARGRHRSSRAKANSA